jgi:chromate transporter
LPGALVVTAGIFAPASLHLLAHHPLERLMHHPRARIFLEGITAGVVGLIATPPWASWPHTLRDVPTVLVFAAAARLPLPLQGPARPLYALAAAALAGALRYLVLPV